MAAEDAVSAAKEHDSMRRDERLRMKRRCCLIARGVLNSDEGKDSKIGGPNKDEVRMVRTRDKGKR